MIPLHPEATADPHTIRWVVPAATLDFIGTPQSVPAPLATLLAEGTLTALTVEPAAVLTTSDGDWRTLGARVRTVLAESLADPAGWRAPTEHAPVLAAAVAEVIAGEVGEYVRSHGGTARLVGVEGSLATIALDGACASCPARGATLGLRFGRAVEALCPGAEVMLEETRRPPVFRIGPRRG